MTEEEFRRAFAGTGWDVRYERGKSNARVRLTSGDTAITAWTTWTFDSRAEGLRLRDAVFKNAASDLSGTPRLSGDKCKWSWAGWSVNDEWTASPGWYRDQETGRCMVGSVEEFAFKLSMLSSR